MRASGHLPRQRCTRTPVLKHSSHGMPPLCSTPLHSAEARPVYPIESTPSHKTHHSAPIPAYPEQLSPGPRPPPAQALLAAAPAETPRRPPAAPQAQPTTGGNGAAAPPPPEQPHAAANPATHGQTGNAPRHQAPDSA